MVVVVANVDGVEVVVCAAVVGVVVVMLGLVVVVEPEALDDFAGFGLLAAAEMITISAIAPRIQNRFFRYHGRGAFSFTAASSAV